MFRLNRSFCHDKRSHKQQGQMRFRGKIFGLSRTPDFQEGKTITHQSRCYPLFPTSYDYTRVEAFPCDGGFLPPVRSTCTHQRTAHRGKSPPKVLE